MFTEEGEEVGSKEKKENMWKDVCQKEKKDGNRRQQKINEEQKIRIGKCDQKPVQRRK